MTVDKDINIGFKEFNTSNFKIEYTVEEKRIKKSILGNQHLFLKQSMNQTLLHFFILYRTLPPILNLIQKMEKQFQY